MVLGGKYKLDRRGILSFYRNRFFRLAPSYWLAIIACLYLAWSTGRTFYGVDANSYWELLKNVHPLTAFWIVFTNLMMIGQDTLIFLRLDGGGFAWNAQMNLVPGAAMYLLLIPQAWSLGVELWFYLIAPFLAGRRSRVIVIVLSASLFARVIAALYGYSDEPWKDRFFPFELAWFIAGMLLQREYARNKSRIAPWVGPLIFAATLISMLIYRLLPMDPEVWHWLYLALFLLAVPFLFHWSKSSSVDRAIGELSYPLYLCHTIVQQGIGGFTIVDGLPSWIFTTIVALGISVLLYLFVDRPMDQWRQRLAKAG